MAARNRGAGGTVTAKGASLEALRRQSGGAWRYLIDCPAGIVNGRRA